MADCGTTDALMPDFSARLADAMSQLVATQDSVNERDMQPAAEDVLRELLAGSALSVHGVGSQLSRTPRMSGFAPAGFPDAELGTRKLRGSGVDIVLADDRDQWHSMFELKWSKGGGDDTLANCLWDLLKLATAVREGLAPCGYLVAGGPPSAFSEQIPGTEPFRHGHWSIDTPGLLTEPSRRTWWARWRANVSVRPRLVPEHLVTEWISPASDPSKGDGIQIAIARVGFSGPARRCVSDGGDPGALVGGEPVSAQRPASPGEGAGASAPRRRPRPKATIWSRLARLVRPRR